jgi:ribonuclease HII
MICGIDEAGRGSVMGPLVVGSVCIGSDSPLRDIGVKDSKKLSPAVRERMFDLITDACDSTCTVVASAADIDERRKRQSLNIIELDMFLESVSGMKADVVYADCPDVNESDFSAIMTVRLNGVKVVAEHKADDTYPVVSAASIIAKVTRDRMMESISKEFGVDVGSGYPSDHFTMDFIEKWIKDNGSPPKHTRCSWEPVRHLMSASKNTRLSDW